MPSARWSRRPDGGAGGVSRDVGQLPWVIDETFADPDPVSNQVGLGHVGPGRWPLAVDAPGRPRPRGSAYSNQSWAGTFAADNGVTSTARSPSRLGSQAVREDGFLRVFQRRNLPDGRPSSITRPVSTEHQLCAGSRRPDRQLSRSCRRRGRVRRQLPLDPEGSVHDSNGICASKDFARAAFRRSGVEEHGGDVRDGLVAHMRWRSGLRACRTERRWSGSTTCQPTSRSSPSVCLAECEAFDAHDDDPRWLAQIRVRPRRRWMMAELQVSYSFLTVPDVLRTAQPKDADTSSVSIRAPYPVTGIDFICGTERAAG